MRFGLSKPAQPRSGEVPSHLPPGRGRVWLFGPPRISTLSVSAQGAGLYRIADASLVSYLLYRGINGPPNLAGSPYATFASLPHTTAAQDPGNEYRYVLRRRNAYGLVSQNAQETAIDIAGDGTQNPVRPSGPSVVEVSAAAAGTVLVEAEYLYLTDGVNAADTWLLYVTTGGASPNPATDAPFAEVAIDQVDGVAKLSHTLGAYAEGTVVRVIVRTRREGSPDVDSTNTDVHSATATLLGPAGVGAAADAFLGTSARVTPSYSAFGDTDLRIWLDGQGGALGSAALLDGSGNPATADSTPVATWKDGNGLSAWATQSTAADRMLLRTGANGLNGRPVSPGDGVSRYFSLPATLMTGAAAAMAIWVAKLTLDPPVVNTKTGPPLGDFGTAAVADHYPFADGVVYHDFGSTTRQTCGDPALSLANWRVCTIVSAPGTWQIWIDGVSLFGPVANTVAWNSAPKVGRSDGGGGPYLLDGKVATCLVWEGQFTDAERKAREAFASWHCGM